VVTVQIQIDKRNPNIVLLSFQFGNYYRIDRATNKRRVLFQKPKKDENHSFQLANTYFIVFSQSRYFVYGIIFAIVP
jgi:hypothetical protein